MPDWLKDSFQPSEHFSPLELLWRIGIAFVLGGVVALIYLSTHRKEPGAPTFPRTLVLLAILIAMVTQVIGDSVARAFSLVGALSIVRFRTVVQDTQDTAFVIFAVVVGMAAGADHLWVAIIGIGVVGLAVLVTRPRRSAAGVWAGGEGTLLTLRTGTGHNPEALAKSAFAKHLTYFETVSVSTAKQGTAIDVTFRVRLRAGETPTELVKELSQVEGVLSVDVRQEEDDD